MKRKHLSEIVRKIIQEKNLDKMPVKLSQFAASPDQTKKLTNHPSISIYQQYSHLRDPVTPSSSVSPDAPNTSPFQFALLNYIYEQLLKHLVSEWSSMLQYVMIILFLII